MTTATRTELMQIAKEAAAYITKLNGGSETFEIEGPNLTAVIDAGDRWTAPCSWVECEEAQVVAVYDEEGDDDLEATEWLKKMLN